jgi:1,4-alpha-glucan branching enzyme
VLKKGPVVDGKREVTFELPGAVSGNSVHLCGEFNDWSESSLPLHKNASDNFEVTIFVESGRRYRYRYLIDNARWENDWMADDYVTNEYGGEDSALDA